MTARQVMTVEMRNLQVGDYCEWLGGSVSQEPRSNGDGEAWVRFDNGVRLSWRDVGRTIEIERPYPPVMIPFDVWKEFADALEQVHSHDVRRLTDKQRQLYEACKVMWDSANA